jgi:hypothetical protein
MELWPSRSATGWRIQAAAILSAVWSARISLTGRPVVMHLVYGVSGG